jgi:hypothetical protein
MACLLHKFYFYRQCPHIVFILQCQKVLNNCQNVLKSAETWLVLNVLGCPLSCQHLYCYRFLLFALNESGTRKGLLGPWLNNTEVYLTPLLELKITWLLNKLYSTILWSLNNWLKTRNWKSTTGKPAHAVTSIQQSPVLNVHLFLVLR